MKLCFTGSIGGTLVYAHAELDAQDLAFAELGDPDAMARIEALTEKALLEAEYEARA